jgi:hypothetical protein
MQNGRTRTAALTTLLPAPAPSFHVSLTRAFHAGGDRYKRPYNESLQQVSATSNSYPTVTLCHLGLIASIEQPMTFVI